MTVLARDFISDISHFWEANRGPHALFHGGDEDAANAFIDVLYVVNQAS